MKNAQVMPSHKLGNWNAQVLIISNHLWNSAKVGANNWNAASLRFENRQPRTFAKQTLREYVKTVVEYAHISI
jgi:hypothetical protein